MAAGAIFPGRRDGSCHGNDGGKSVLPIMRTIIVAECKMGTFCTYETLFFPRLIAEI